MSSNNSETPWASAIRKFCDYESNLGFVKSTVTVHRNILLRNARDLTFEFEGLIPEQIGKEHIELVRRTYARRKKQTVDRALRVITCFAAFYQKTSPEEFARRTGSMPVPWYAGRRCPHPWADELQSFCHYAGLSEKNRERIDLLLEVLNWQCGAKDLSEIGPGQIGAIIELMKEDSKGCNTGRRTALMQLDGFFRYTVGTEPYDAWKSQERTQDLIQSLGKGGAEFMICLEEYRADLLDRGVSERSADKTTEVALQGYKAVVSTVGPIEPSKIDKKIVRAVNRAMTEAGYAGTTRESQLATLGRCLRVVYGSNPTVEAEIVWAQSEPVRKQISLEEYQKVLENCNPEEKAILLFASHMGLRHQEICDICLSDIRGNRLFIHGKGRGTGKTMVRTMPPSVQEALRIYLDLRQEVLSVSGDRSEGKLWINLKREKGKPASYDYLTAIVAEVRRRTGTDLGLHALRRLFGQMLYTQGFDLVSIQHMMRHSTPATTAIYLSTLPNTEDRACDAIESLCKG